MGRSYFLILTVGEWNLECVSLGGSFAWLLDTSYFMRKASLRYIFKSANNPDQPVHWTITSDKRDIQINIFLISPQKPMLWVIIRSTSPHGEIRKISVRFSLKQMPYLKLLYSVILAVWLGLCYSQFFSVEYEQGTVNVLTRQHRWAGWFGQHLLFIWNKAGFSVLGLTWCKNKPFWPEHSLLRSCFYLPVVGLVNSKWVKKFLFEISSKCCVHLLNK